MLARSCFYVAHIEHVSCDDVIWRVILLGPSSGDAQVQVEPIGRPRRSITDLGAPFAGLKAGRGRARDVAGPPFETAREPLDEIDSRT